MRTLEAAARRVTRLLDSAMHRVYGWPWNPLHQSGALAAWLLVVLTATGLYLIIVYRLSAPAQSVQRLAADPWLGSWMRSLHRYATDAFVVAALLHAVRLVGQAREWGPRRRAWVSGVFLVGVGLVCAWTGFVMAWDTFGARLAVEGARLFDALPILSEPVGRIFAGDRQPPAAFFFLNLFVHIALPLAMGVGFWVHISKVARPVLAPPKALRWSLTALLALVSVLLPASLGPAAGPLRLPDETPVDLATSWWLPLAERSPPWLVWGLVLSSGVLVLLVPRFGRRPRTASWAPSVVDPRLCTGCDQCTQDCPWEAIAMVPRADARPSLVALVDPARCVSCGICAGSCAPMGVGPPGRTGREQLAALEAGFLPGLRLAPVDERVVVICCSQAASSARASLTGAGAHVLDVECVGALHSSVIERLTRQGAAGVMVAACPPRDCVGREGPKWLEQRIYHDREAELQARVDRRRVQVVTLAVGREPDAISAFTAFRAGLERLDLPVTETTGELPAECEPATSGSSA